MKPNGTGWSLISNYTGEKLAESRAAGFSFDDITEAIESMRDYGLVSYSQLSPNPSQAIGRQFAFSPLKAEARSINQYIIRGLQDPNGEEANALRRVGLGSLLDRSELFYENGNPRLRGAFEIRALRTSYELGTDPREKLRSLNMIKYSNPVTGEVFNEEGDGLVETLMGLAVGDEEGFSFLEYGLPGQRLTEHQIATLKTLVGDEVLNVGTLVRKLGDEGGLEDIIGKLTKRQKSFTSPRQVSIAGQGIGDFLFGNAPQASQFTAQPELFGQSIHIFNPRAELLAARFGVDDALVGQIVGNFRFYEGANISQEAASLFDYTTGQLTTNQQNTLGQLAQQAFQEAADQNTDPVAVFEGLVNNSNLSQSLKNKVNASLKNMEISVDGEFVMNRVNLENSVNQWAQTVANVQNEINNRPAGMSVEEFMETYDHSRIQNFLDAKQMLETVGQEVRDEDGIVTGYTLRSDIDKIGFSGRIMYIDENGQKRFIKGRMRVGELPAGISVATPDIMIKKETAAEQFINFDIVSGTGKKAASAPDIQTLLFHRQEFYDIDPNTLMPSLPQTTLSYGASMMDELQEIQRTRNNSRKG